MALLLQVHPHMLLCRPSARLHVHLKPVSMSSSTSSSSFHGPSLRRGRTVPDHPDPFARAFDLAALRVPVGTCALLESRLRGHLLNWPRVRNIARLPNDQGLALALSLPSPTRRRPTMEECGPPQMATVVQREKLAREFNARGFTHFPSLARLSRPSSRKRKEKKGGDSDEEATRPLGKDKAYVVRVVAEGGHEDADDWKGLLGEEGLGNGAWRMGPTRLLLLDERYTGIRVDELPEAVKVVLDHETAVDGSSAYELIRCQITLLYCYWPMNEVLEAILPEGIIIPTGFETVGHIAHLNLRDEHLPHKKLIAQVVLDKNKPKIQTVVNKTDAIQNDYRTMQLEVLAGKDSLRTTVLEF